MSLPQEQRLRLSFNDAGKALKFIGDPERVVRELRYHIPRIVQNQQRLGPIVGIWLAITTAWNRR